MKTQEVKRVWTVLSFLVCVALAAWGQLNTGSISGTVKDPSGAVVPNAKVTIIDTSKGFTYNTVTDASGIYTVRDLPPSTYTVRIEAPGFTRFERPGVVVEVSQNVNADASLQVAAAGQTVTVSEQGATMLQTEDAAVGQTVNRTYVNDLPLITRGVFDLAYLAPGVSEAPGQAYGNNGSSVGNNFVSDGSRNAQSDILLDGVSTTNYDQNSGWVDPLYTPSVEAIQEFRVQQTNFSAEYGFTGGTVINAVTRSGTNQFHGELYDFIRNNDFNANGFFNNKAGVPTPAYHQNDFGGTFGGPIKKDRIFFFGDYEGNYAISPSAETLGLPDAAERSGNFGELCSRAGGTFNSAGICSNPNGQIYDPYSNLVQVNGAAYRTTPIPFNNLATYASPLNGSPAVNYTIGGKTYTGSGQAVPTATLGMTPGVAGNLMNPVALKILQYLPLPNQAGASPYANFYGVAPDPSHHNQFDIRTDARLTDNDQLTVKFGESIGLGLNGGNVLGSTNCGSLCGPFDNGTQGNNTYTAISTAVNFTHTFNATTVLTASAGYTHSWSHTHGTGALYPNFSPCSSLGMPSYICQGNALNEAPSIVLDNYGTVGTQTWDVLLYGSDVYQMIGSVAHTAGNHDLHFGGEFRVHRINFTQYGIPDGRFEFNNGGTNETANVGGDSIASFLVGFPTGWSAYQIPAQPATQNLQYAGFIQDNWHFNDRLTLNLGLRYDVDVPRTERYNRMTYFDPTVPSPLQQVVQPSGSYPGCPACAGLMGSFEFVGQNGNPRTPYNTYWGAIGPRVGLAYRIGTNTTVRTGYGIYYDPSKGGAAGVGVGGGAFMGYNSQPTMAEYNSSDNITPAANLSNPFPGGSGIIGSITGNSLANYIALPGGDSGSAPIRNFAVLPQEQSWSFGVEHQFAGNMLLDVEYVGRKGTHLYFGGDTYAVDHISPAGADQYYAGNANAMNSNVTWPQAIGCQQLFLKSGFGAYSNACWNGSFQMYNLYTAYPQYPNGVWGSSAVQITDPPWANSIYNGLQVRLEKRMAHGLQFLFTYSWQKSIDDSSANGSNEYIDTGVSGSVGTSVAIQDPNNLALERSLSTFDIPQIFQFTWVYQLPFGKGKTYGGNWNRLMDGVFGGWQLQGTYRWDDGLPIQLTLANGQSIPMGYNQRPNYPTQLVVASDYGSTLQYFTNNPNANGTLAQCSAWVPCPYFDGTAPRTLNVRQPGTNNLTASLFKQFPLWNEASKLEFGAEVFNALNHVQFAVTGSATTINGGSFGVITQQANNIGGDTRVMQLRLKMYF